MPSYKDEKTGKWYVKFRIKDWKGDTKYITKRGFSTKRDASAWETDYRTTQNGSSDMKFADFAILYKRDIEPRIKASTMETKRNIIDKQIVPYFGKKKINEITSADIMQWQNIMLSTQNPKSGKCYSKSYLKTVHNQLSAMFNHAVKYYHLPCNYASIVGNMGHEKETKSDFWTLPEYQCFLSQLIDHPDAYYAFELLYWCGIREGELLALTKNDFDFTTNTLTINKTYHRMNGKDYITSPKTSKSVRTILIPHLVAEELKDYFSMRYCLNENERVFQITKRYLFDMMKLGSAKAKVKQIRIHDLRHSHVSLLISLGYSAVAIADRLGHESYNVTYRYAHLFPSTQKEMVHSLNALMEE